MSTTPLAQRAGTPGTGTQARPTTPGTQRAQTPGAHSMARRPDSPGASPRSWRMGILQGLGLPPGAVSAARGPQNQPQQRREDSFFEKVSTLGRRKKMEEAENVELEGQKAIDAGGIALPRELMPEECQLVEGEERNMVSPESLEDTRVHEIIRLLVTWLNNELNEMRIVVKDIQEDIYDGLVIQKLIEKMTGLRIEYPEVAQSEIGQLERLRMVLGVANQLLARPKDWRAPQWTPESVHNKELLPILHLLIALALHFRAPIRFPENVNVQVIVVQKKDGVLRHRYVSDALTTVQSDLGLPGEKDAFDTLFGHGPDTLEKVKRSLVSFSNKYLNRINLEVSDLETQFQDGVFLVLLMGLLEGYFVPLYSFHLQVTSFEQKVANVTLAFYLMQEAGLPKPRARPEDIVNGDLKCTMRVLHMLFVKYKYTN